MRRVATGDRAAFACLMELHQASIGAYAQRMVGDRSLAEDIVQETFLRLWSHAGRFRPERARLATWLHRIAHNLCIDRHRGAARMTLSDEPADSLAPGGTLATLHEAREQGARLRLALSALPERQRSALLLCHYQGLSNRDVAKILDVSVEALESLLARARRALKTLLEPDDEQRPHQRTA